MNAVEFIEMLTNKIKCDPDLIINRIEFEALYD